MSVTNFSKNLYRLRMASGLSQSEMARRLQVRRQTVWKWEKALNSPDPDVLANIANIIGCSVDELVMPVQEAS